MHTHAISELQKVKFTVTDFNSILFLRLLHTVPARLAADSCSVRDKLKYWNSSWWIKRHAAHMPSSTEPDWFVCLWFQVGRDPSEESADVLREAVLCVLWVVTLGLLSCCCCCWSLWNAAQEQEDSDVMQQRHPVKLKCRGTRLTKHLFCHENLGGSYRQHKNDHSSVLSVVSKVSLKSEPWERGPNKKRTEFFFITSISSWWKFSPQKAS